MDASRRDFCKGAAAIVLGGAAVAAPVGAGLAALLSPLHADPAGAGVDFVRVASLDAAPADNVPRRFTVYADRVDAWSKFPHEAVGAVYLRRDAGGRIEALNAVCPHAGGFIDYDAAKQCFLCPVHKSLFKIDGAIADAKSPAPRAMDSLETQVREGAIWVRFQNFRVGIARKIPA